MAKFIPGTDFEVKSDEAKLDVLVSDTTPLAVGKHIFQLIVADDSGNESAPAIVTIIVQDTARPTAVVDVVDARGNRNPEPQVSIPFGERFQLSGDRSSDIGGAVTTWHWTLVRP